MPVLKMCADCRKLIPLGNVYCEKCAPKHERKPSPWNDLYKTKEWRAISKQYLIEHPFCEECGDVATDVHHRIAHRGRLDVFFDIGNLQSLCHKCHTKKTNQEIADRRK